MQAMRRMLGRAVVPLALLAASPCGGAQDLGDIQPVSGFSVPTYDEEGNLTSKLFGDYAKILPDGLVEITGLRVEFYSGGETNRRTDMRVSSPKCFFHRGKGVAMSDSSVRIARDNMVVTGEGFVWDSKKEHLRIAKDAKVVFKDFRRNVDQGANP
jgi:hypothetical protein